ncbi:MAG: hypothetical protein COB85_02825 [Bacteroidetes bacterium]|nr:MAG: hypothetical protein COB85_02825 [Bacteroidota bacterium]
MDEFLNRNSYHPIKSERLITRPAVNIQETNTDFLVEVAAPGFQKNDFTVEIDNNQLIISSKREDTSDESGNHFTKREFTYGSFQRTFTLPESVKEDKITAKYEDGILKLTLPKQEEALIKPAREIKIS